jgi:hypothetical protein
MTSKNIKHGYKGLMLNFYLDFKKIISISTIVVLSLTTFDFIVTLLIAQFSKSYGSERSAGVLLIGSVIMLIAFCIHTIKSTSKDTIKSKFAFPINRLMYSVVNFIAIVIGSLIMMMIITIIAPFEMILYRVTALFTDKLYYLSMVTLNNLFVGFISSWMYLIAISSLLYFIFMYIRKYTIVSLIVITISIFSILTFGWLGNIISFVFLEQNLGIFVLKLSAVTIITHLLAYIPTKTMEVA